MPAEIGDQTALAREPHEFFSHDIGSAEVASDAGHRPERAEAFFDRS
jgi:hypothetical protein